MAFLCPNTPELLEAHFAVPAAGAILVAMNTRLSAEDVAYILDHSGARMLFVDTDLEQLVAGRPIPRSRASTTPARPASLRAFLDAASAGR